MTVCSLGVWCVFFFLFKQKTAYEMRISDWSSDVCSSDLEAAARVDGQGSAAPGAGQRPLPPRPAASGDRRRPPPPVRGQGPAAGLAAAAGLRTEIARASCRERVCQYV